MSNSKLSKRAVFLTANVNSNAYLGNVLNKNMRQFGVAHEI